MSLLRWKYRNVVLILEPRSNSTILLSERSCTFICFWGNQQLINYWTRKPILWVPVAVWCHSTNLSNITFVSVAFTNISCFPSRDLGKLNRTSFVLFSYVRHSVVSAEYNNEVGKMLFIITLENSKFSSFLKDPFWKAVLPIHMFCIE